jgi:hypothetical protein
MKSTRKKMPRVSAITTATLIVELSPGQCFYRTGTAWEIWECGKMPKLVKRFPSKRVYWVSEAGPSSNSQRPLNTGWEKSIQGDKE